MFRSKKVLNASTVEESNFLTYSARVNFSKFK